MHLYLWESHRLSLLEVLEQSVCLFRNKEWHLETGKCFAYRELGNCKARVRNKTLIPSYIHTLTHIHTQTHSLTHSLMCTLSFLPFSSFSLSVNLHPHKNKWVVYFNNGCRYLQTQLAEIYSLVRELIILIF